MLDGCMSEKVENPIFCKHCPFAEDSPDCKAFLRTHPEYIKIRLIKR